MSCGGTSSNINTKNYDDNKNANNNANTNVNKNTNDNKNNNESNNVNMKEIARRVFSEQSEALDDKGYLNQYAHQTSSGYYIGFENGPIGLYK